MLAPGREKLVSAVAAAFGGLLRSAEAKHGAALQVGWRLLAAEALWVQRDGEALPAARA